MSIYTEYMNRLCKVSKDIDSAKVTGNGFAELQRLESAIIDGEQRGYYDYRQRKQLQDIALYLHNEYRETLALNERVKEIERNIKKQRRVERREAVTE